MSLSHAYLATNTIFAQPPAFLSLLRDRCRVCHVTLRCSAAATLQWAHTLVVDGTTDYLLYAANQSEQPLVQALVVHYCKLLVKPRISPLRSARRRDELRACLLRQLHLQVQCSELP
jgi:hypothetical protein